MGAFGCTSVAVIGARHRRNKCCRCICTACCSCSTCCRCSCTTCIISPPCPHTHTHIHVIAPALTHRVLSPSTRGASRGPSSDTNDAHLRESSVIPALKWVLHRSKPRRRVPRQVQESACERSNDCHDYHDSRSRAAVRCQGRDDHDSRSRTGVH